MRLDVRIDGDLREIGDQVRGLAAAGVAGAFTYEGPAEPFLPLAAAAAAGTGLDLYTNLAIALPRSPMHLAQTAHQLQQSSGGRFALGLGTQVARHVRDRYGATWESPVAQLREITLAVKAIQHAWRTGEPLDFTGRWTRHTYCPPLFVPAPHEHADPPVLWGALGPKMSAAAVEVADGVLVHPFTTDRSVAELTLPALASARPGFTVVGQAIVATGRDEAEVAQARSAARTLLAFYASTPAYRPVLDLHGFGELQPALRDLTRAGRWADLPAAVPAELVDLVVVSGEPAAVGAALGRRFARCSRVALSLPHTPSYAVLGEVAAAVRALPSGENTF